MPNDMMKNPETIDAARSFLARKDEAARDAAAEAAATVAALYLTDEEMAAPIEEMPEVIESLLFRDEVHILAAESGNSKTTLVLDVAIDFALNRRCLGTFDPCGDNRRVLFVSSEDRRTALVMMFRKSLRDKCLSPEECEVARTKLAFYDLAEKRTALHDFDSGTRAFCPSQLHRSLEGLIERVRPAIVVLDPLGMFLGGPENDNDYLMVFMKDLRAMTARQHCALLGNHHVSKDVARGGTTDQYVGRGASALSSNARGFFQLRIAEKAAVSYRDAVWETDLFSAEQINEGRAMFFFRHKYSYQKPMMYPIAVLRDGHAFRARRMTRQNADAANSARLIRQERMVAMWIAENAPPHGFTKTQIRERGSELPEKLSRDALTATIARLGNKLLLENHPTAERNGHPLIVGARAPREDEEEAF